jgi:hypothetical protein
MAKAYRTDLVSEKRICDAIASLGNVEGPERLSCPVDGCACSYEVYEYVLSHTKSHRHPPSQTWRTFLANHVKELVSADFFVVPTATFRLLFVFVILSHDPSPTSALCGDETSDRGMDSPAALAGLPLGHGSALFVARSRQRLWRGIP